MAVVLIGQNVSASPKYFSNTLNIFVNVLPDRVKDACEAVLFDRWQGLVLAHDRPTSRWSRRRIVMESCVGRVNAYEYWLRGYSRRAVSSSTGCIDVSW